jgi:hypothetical protein
MVPARVPQHPPLTDLAAQRNRPISPDHRFHDLCDSSGLYQLAGRKTRRGIRKMVWIIYQCPYGWGLISRMVGDVFAGIRFVAVPIAVNDNI